MSKFSKIRKGVAVIATCSIFQHPESSDSFFVFPYAYINSIRTIGPLMNPLESSFVSLGNSLVILVLLVRGLAKIAFSIVKGCLWIDMVGEYPVLKCQSENFSVHKNRALFVDATRSMTERVNMPSRVFLGVPLMMGQTLLIFCVNDCNFTLGQRNFAV